MEVSDVAVNALYHLLAALGFPEPTLNKKGLPTIAWPETKTGISLGPRKSLEGGTSSSSAQSWRCSTRCSPSSAYSA